MFPYAEGDYPPEWGQVTIALIIINTFAFAAEVMGNPWPMDQFLAHLGFVAAHPVWYTWITSLFLHGGAEHLIGNMWALWIFGHRIEGRLGPLYLPLYLIGGLFANGVMMLADPTSTVPCIGASGAIAAVIGAYAVLYPKNRLRFWDRFGGSRITYSMSALVFAAIWGFFEFVDFANDPDARQTGIAHGAHVGGIIVGLLAGYFLSGTPDESVSVGGADIEAGLTSNGQDAVKIYLADLGSLRRPRLSAQVALAVADNVSTARQPHLARALLRQLLAEQPGPAEPGAWLLSGFVEGGQLGWLASSAQSYARAAAHPQAEPEVKADAAARLSRVRAHLNRAVFEELAPGEPAWMLAEGLAFPDSDQRDLCDAALKSAGLSSGAAIGGILAVNQPGDRLAECARSLQLQGLAAVVVPSRCVVRLQKPTMIESLAANASGANLGGVKGLAWDDVLAAAAYGISMSGFVEKEKGLLDVALENVVASQMTRYGIETSEARAPTEYEQKKVLTPVVDVVTADGARWRWTLVGDAITPEEALRQTRVICFALASSTPSMALNDAIGALAAGDPLPAHCVFSDFESAEVYLAWQAQLARLRRLDGFAAG